MNPRVFGIPIHMTLKIVGALIQAIGVLIQVIWVPVLTIGVPVHTQIYLAVWVLVIPAAKWYQMIWITLWFKVLMKLKSCSSRKKLLSPIPKTRIISTTVRFIFRYFTSIFHLILITSFSKSRITQRAKTHWYQV
jgi:hypothetical protein